MKYSLKSKLIFISTVVITTLLFPPVQTHLYAQVQEQRDFAVTAVVPPNQGDFQFSFASDGQTTIPQRTTLEYEITYGAQASAGLATETTITVDFSDDIAPGGSHVVDYVIGSASNAYGGTTPVVDLLNRTITWTIPSLPAGTTNQIVSFQLRTNENYTDIDPVTFITKAGFNNAYITFPDQTVTQTYQFDLGLVTPTPTQSPTPTITPTPTVTPTGMPGPSATAGPRPTSTPAPTILTPTPTIRSNAPQILDISFSGITDSSAQVTVASDRPTQVTVMYGTDENALTKTLITSEFSRLNTVTISNLDASTTYYFQVIVVDASGRSVRSEIFTFKTAETSETPQAQNDAVIIKSGETVLLSSILNGQNNANFVILPSQISYQVLYTFALPQASSTIIEVLLRNENGIDRRVKMVSKDGITFTAELRTNDIGTYNLEVIQSDDKGNIMSRKISDLKTVSPFRVLESELNTPLADAKIILYSFNQETKQFEIIKGSFYTNSVGELSPLLSAGRYKAEISAWGYQHISVEFALGRAQGEDYPTVRLEKNPFDLTYLTNAIKDWFDEAVSTAISMFKNLSSSVRVFYVTATASVVSVTALGLMLFQLRTDIKIQDFLPYFLFGLSVAAKRHHEEYIHGFIIDEEKNPLTGVRIEILNIKSGQILGHGMTNKSGRFAIKNVFSQEYVKLVIAKEAYVKKELIAATNTQKDIFITLFRHEKVNTPIVYGFKHIVGEFFEFVLFASFLMELVFIFTFGVAMALPFFLISAFNLLLWLFYSREKGLLKK